MKLISKVYISFQLLDCIITLFALKFLGMYEMNPLFDMVGGNWIYFMAIKLLCVTIAVFMLEKIFNQNEKINWIFPISALIPIGISLNNMAFVLKLI